MPVPFSKLLQATEFIHDSVPSDVVVDAIEILNANAVTVVYDGILSPKTRNILRKSSFAKFGVDLLFVLREGSADSQQ